MGASPSQNIYIRKYRRFTNPVKVTMYCTFPNGRDESEGKKNFVRTLSGHFVGVSICPFTGWFLEPCGMRLDPIFTDTLPSEAKHIINLTTPEPVATVSFSPEENIEKRDRRTEMRALYFSELRDQGWVFAEDLISWYCEEVSNDPEIIDEFSELPSKPKELFDSVSDYYEVKLMTEEYRIQALLNIKEVFGDNVIEIAWFCGITIQESHGLKMDAREKILEMLANKPDDASYESWMKDKSLFRKFAFNNDSRAMVSFALRNPKFISNLLRMEGYPIERILIAIFSIAVLIVAIYKQIC